MKTGIIRQAVTFAAGPRAVYDALMDARRHAAFTGAGAALGRRIGDPFSVYDGALSGMNLDLRRDRRIVWAWRSSDWPYGHYSKVTISLSRAKRGTRLTLTHSGVPARERSSISRGWHRYYWDPLSRYLED